ncbi:hypothetical protein HPB50_007540 [Hyalomma asiaticum]|uniref:Uncharacterized protein n=1 Tax=Hyalomma asiaticum TaxID=266040 RepID=A0ACB7RKZ5_HYAAI|nr:hypothetical protein HPB50_007540 [Hyalomma asiaticum]
MPEFGVEVDSFFGEATYRLPAPLNLTPAVLSAGTRTLQPSTSMDCTVTGTNLSLTTFNVDEWKEVLDARKQHHELKSKTEELSQAGIASVAIKSEEVRPDAVKTPAQRMVNTSAAERLRRGPIPRLPFDDYKARDIGRTSKSVLIPFMSDRLPKSVKFFGSVFGVYLVPSGTRWKPVRIADELGTDEMCAPNQCALIAPTADSSARSITNALQLALCAAGITERVTDFADGNANVVRPNGPERPGHLSAI